MLPWIILFNIFSPPKTKIMKYRREKRENRVKKGWRREKKIINFFAYSDASYHINLILYKKIILFFLPSLPIYFKVIFVISMKNSEWNWFLWRIRESSIMKRGEGEFYFKFLIAYSKSLFYEVPRENSPISEGILFFTRTSE